MNRLFGREVDPISRQPELKHEPVEVRRSELVARATLVLAGDHAALGRELLAGFEWGVVTCLGSERVATLVELASRRDPEPEELAAIDRAIDGAVGAADRMQYADRHARVDKRLWVRQDRLVAVRWTRAHAAGVRWLLELVLAGGDVNEVRSLLLAPLGAAVPASSGPNVCSCMNVGARAIERAIQAGARTVDAVQRTCRAGTGCGSCIPEIKRLLTLAS